jgi:hypothetical protein
MSIEMIRRHSLPAVSITLSGIPRNNSSSILIISNNMISRPVRPEMIGKSFVRMRNSHIDLSLIRSDSMRLEEYVQVHHVIDDDLEIWGGAVPRTSAAYNG